MKAVKGMRDILPPESFFWGRVEELARAIFCSFGFEEIRTPMVEETALFVRGIGEGTDIVHKEMYTFDDKKGRSLTMRPEMTAGVARSVIEHQLQQRPLPLRLWYFGPMFRYERPQKGRYRQFHQIGAEMFGLPGPEADAEVIATIFALLDRLRFRDLTLRLNSVGDAMCRPAYSEALRLAAERAGDRLCGDCQRRVTTNPLRLLDCKVPECKAIAATLPVPADFLCEGCRDHSERLAEILDALDLPVESDPRLVRGLDYYTRTVFEVSAGGLGSQDAVVGGGRYDRLVEDLGGPSLPAVGFSAGVDRLIEILSPEFREEETRSERERVVVIPIGREAQLYAFRVAAQVREAGLDARLELGGKKPKALLARAAEEAFAFAILVGEDEMEADTVTLRDLAAHEQREVPFAELTDTLEQEMARRFAAHFLEEHSTDEATDETEEGGAATWTTPDAEEPTH